MHTVHVASHKQPPSANSNAAWGWLCVGIIMFATHSLLVLQLLSDSIHFSHQLSASSTPSWQRNIVSWCLGFVHLVFAFLTICCWLLCWSAADLLVVDASASDVWQSLLLCGCCCQVYLWWLLGQEKFMVNLAKVSCQQMIETKQWTVL